MQSPLSNTLTTWCARKNSQRSSSQDYDHPLTLGVRTQQWYLIIWHIYMAAPNLQAIIYIRENPTRNCSNSSRLHFLQSSSNSMTSSWVSVSNGPVHLPRKSLLAFKIPSALPSTCVSVAWSVHHQTFQPGGKKVRIKKVPVRHFGQNKNDAWSVRQLTCFAF